VRRLKPGDEVYARPDQDRIGTFAELISIKEGSVAKKPKSLTMIEAASIPLVGVTAWQALIEKADLKKGQKVFIQAGSGGCGHLRHSAGEAPGCDGGDDNEHGKRGLRQGPRGRHRRRLQERRLRKGPQ
jgi:D-arabinose 1-dehydrogenase-like Zn-dependent alcohol dehydrogenase